MNQKLQNIFDLIKQSEKLDAEQKDKLLKAVKDADKELEITAFKLERTEKVKKTTAILLEETIEELEQKRKAVEEQNRELEIETSLERVRAVAMSMGRSEDLLNICEASFKEFQKLGFVNLRNAIIHIPNDKQKYFMDYDYSEFTGGAITKIEYGSHPIVDEYLEKIRSAEDAYFEVVITEDQLAGWKDFRKKSGQKDDPRLGDSTALYYNLFSIGIGDIGISTFNPIDESQIKILNRFRNVFDLAYRRYNDIALAEAQAREAQIETALERVRARSMGMHHTDELNDVLCVLLEQFDFLGINPVLTHLTLFDEANNKFSLRLTTSPTEKILVEQIIDINAVDTWKASFENWKKGDPDTVDCIDYPPEVLPAVWQVMSEVMNALPEGHKINPQDFPDGLYTTQGHCKFGYIGFNHTRRATEEEKNIVSRFATEFGRSYQRFLDLQRAEAQAREAQIETALERVRSRTMGMQRSDELQDAAVLLFQQVVALGVPAFGSGFNIWDDDRKSATAWMAGQDRMQPPFKTSSSEDIFLRIYNSAQKGESLFVEEQGGEALKLHYDYMNSIPIFKKIADKMASVGQSFPTFQIMHCAFFSHGYLMFISFEPVPAAYDIFKRFAKVFEQTYTRFLDLKKAEAQAKEAQIEAALERVRAKTMSMHKSNELADAAAVVFQQLINLGIEPNRIYIAIIKDEKGSVEFWITDEDGSKVSSGFEANLNNNRSFRKMFEGWKNKDKSKTIDMQGDELQEYFNHLTKLGVPFKGGLSQKRRLQYIAYFSKGFLGVASPDETKPETLQLLERFAAVFNLTYTRFNDLLQAEAQNKIIQAENDRKTKELEDARQLQISMLPKELPKLPHLDIAVYMKTATEVGGDYYDFNVDENGTLTFIVGDATGHGMMSGMMVSVMKSFFIANRKNIELKEFFESSNNSIKDMKLGRLMMALSAIQITSEKVIATNAGMPSLLYFRNKSQKAGEFVSHNFPLGAMNGNKYSLKEINFESGDVILMMSDGFAELRNENDEQYGYTRIKEEFRSVASKSTNEIVEHLKNSASEWINGTEPDDDVTFVIIKVK